MDSQTRAFEAYAGVIESITECKEQLALAVFHQTEWKQVLKRSSLSKQERFEAHKTLYSLAVTIRLLKKDLALREEEYELVMDVFGPALSE
jgi:hypothetical protein